MKEISTIHHKLFGICCFSGEEAEKIKIAWEKRFFDQDAFWVDVEPSWSAEQIMEALTQTIMKAGVTVLHDQKSMITVFQDATTSLDEGLEQELLRLPTLIPKTYMCHISMVYRFIYCGMSGLMEEKRRAACRNAIRMLHDENHQGEIRANQRMVLIRKQVLEQKLATHWEAAVVFLDLLRRQDNFAALDLGNYGDIGYLQYGEYDVNEKAAVEAEIGRLESLLGDGGSDALSERVKRYFDSVEGELTERLRYQASFQPLHPDLYVEANFLNANRRKARNNKYEPFNRARNLTLDAIEMTGKEISRYAREIMKSKPSAQELIRTMIEDAKLGIEVVRNQDSMNDALASGMRLRGMPMEPRSPELKYNEEGYNQEIGEYFSRCREYATISVLYELKDQLLKAYQEYRLSLESLQEDRSKIQLEIDTLLGRLANMKTEHEFCSGITGAGNGLTRWFDTAIAGGRTERFALCSTAADGERVENHLNPAEISNPKVYWINGVIGGLRKPDNRIRAINNVTIPFSEMLLNDLIPEV